jgi:hypothetical protein
MFRYPGKGGWHFAPVPKRLAPAPTEAWGRTPVEAAVNGTTWRTSVWRGKDGRTLLAIPARVRGAMGDGDRVTVTLRYLIIGLMDMKHPPAAGLRDGDFCDVAGGTHRGKSGTVRDIKKSKTGHLTITVVQSNGVRFKTLAKNVVVKARGNRSKGVD